MGKYRRDDDTFTLIVKLIGGLCLLGLVLIGVLVVYAGIAWAINTVSPLFGVTTHVTWIHVFAGVLLVAFIRWIVTPHQNGGSGS